MKTKALIVFGSALVLFYTSCKRHDSSSDAYGNFESTEVTVSSETAGKILQLHVEEGDILKAGDTVGLTDTTDISLRVQMLRAQRKALVSKDASFVAQGQVLEQQKENLMVEKRRLEALLRDKAATPKQMDDLNGNLRVLEKQIQQVEKQRGGVAGELESLDKQTDQAIEALKKCYLINPVQGTVLTRYAEAGEICIPGKPVYKIADQSVMYLRVYVAGKDLSRIRLGDTVEVLIDEGEKGFRSLEGSISWVSSSAEFTPKIIQTREERVNLVYAVKVRVNNDGSLKINMPGEVKFK